MLDTSSPAIPIETLFDDGPDAMVDLAHRFGSYRTYGEHEKIELDIGRGLLQRHDSTINFLRTGGLRLADEPSHVLAARTAYFREEYAYADEEYVNGIAGFLHHERLLGAARKVHGRPVVQPAIAYANLMVPGQELAVHTDVPEFRGANRKHLPQWLLVVMHHSGLFDRWRLHIATAIAWFHDSDHGALVYWPEGSAGPRRIQHIRANSALVLDTDSVFHGVDRVSDDAPSVIPPVTPSTTLVADGPGWRLVDDGGTVARYSWDDLRFSVSWKAYCFADEDERDAWRDHSDDLRLDTILDHLIDDLVERDVVPRSVERDGALGRTLIDTYIRFPGKVD